MLCQKTVVYLGMQMLTSSLLKYWAKMIGAAVAAAAPAVVQEAVAAILAAMRVAAVVAAAVAAIISPWAAGLAAPREVRIQSQLRGRQTRKRQAETRSVQ